MTRIINYVTKAINLTDSQRSRHVGDSKPVQLKAVKQGLMITMEIAGTQTYVKKVAKETYFPSKTVCQIVAAIITRALPKHIPIACTKYIEISLKSISCQLQLSIII